MPIYQFEAQDATGQEVKNTIEAAGEEEALATIRQMGYYVTKISVRKSRSTAEKKKQARGRKTFALGGVKSKVLTTFTRQLSILQDAGLTILRSLKILEQQSKPGALKNTLIDVCDDIEGGSTLSEAMAKQPKTFNRLFVNMIKAGEAGGALEVILQRLAEFQERSESLKRKVKGALIYPICVVTFAVGILTFIMWKIVPEFEKIFSNFGCELPAMTVMLVNTSYFVLNWWFLIPGIPLSIWLFIKLVRKFAPGRYGWDLFLIKMPIFGQLVEKNICARTMRTLGTLVASGVPILEAMNITKETSNNAVFEVMFQKVLEAIREGEPIAGPLKKYSYVSFHPVALFFWFAFIGGPVGM
ncbi:MAG: type II secretion system F family protein, partial [Planctomycetia bacterium]|nr:type II secretion system F family protein [Planctomycetia bacterium]